MFSPYIQKTTKVIVGVSGGVDSIVLFHLLKKFFKEKSYSLGNIIVAHYHHNQRKQADADQLFVQKLCGKTIVYETEKFGGKKTSEEILRKARYSFFKKIIAKHSADFLVLGHHLDDRIEGTFLNMLRGAHQKGFLGMQQYDGKVLRPLLGLTKQEIIVYAQKEKLKWREDITNEDPTYSKRNFLRKNIIPQLCGLSHRNKNGLVRWYESWKNIYEIMESMPENNKKENDYTDVFAPFSHPRGRESIQQSWVITKKKFLEEISQKEIFVRFLYAKQLSSNITSKRISLLFEFLTKKTSGHLYMEGIYFFHHDNNIYIIQGPKDFWKQSFHTKKKVTRSGKQLFAGGEIFIATDRIGGIIRFPKTGDRFNNKRLKKTFLNEKIPSFLRNVIPVIEKDDKIVGVGECPPPRWGS